MNKREAPLRADKACKLASVFQHAYLTANYICFPADVHQTYASCDYGSPSSLRFFLEGLSDRAMFLGSGKRPSQDLGLIPWSPLRFAQDCCTIALCHGRLHHLLCLSESTFFLSNPYLSSYADAPRGSCQYDRMPPGCHVTRGDLQHVYPM